MFYQYLCLRAFPILKRSLSFQVLEPYAFPNNNRQIYLGDKAVGRSWRRVLHWFEIPSILRRMFRASLEKIGKGGERAQVFQSKAEHAAKNHATA